MDEKDKTGYETMIQKTMEKSKKSRFANYSDMFVGKRGFFAFLKYEFLTTWFSNFPGAVGIALRSIFYKFLFKKVGKGVVFGKSITIRNPSKIVIGNNVIIDENVMLDAKGVDNNGIVLENGVFLGRNTILSCKNGDITLKENVNIGFNCYVVSLNKVEIGEDTLIAAYTYIIGGGHSSEKTDIAFRDQKKHAIGIKIGKNAWFGAKSIIMDGCSVGDNSIIGAGAIVTKDIPEYSVAVGMPAKVVRDRRGKEE